MARKSNHDFADRIDGLFALCEKVLLRTLIFGVFVYELGRFARWLLR
jgi:hypothetical protein